jgi:hypothetical protein
MSLDEDEQLHSDAELLLRSVALGSVRWRRRVPRDDV